MVIGNVVIYAIGVTYLKFAIDASLGDGADPGRCAVPFGDALKIVACRRTFPGPGG